MGFKNPSLLLTSDRDSDMAQVDNNVNHEYLYSLFDPYFTALDINALYHPPPQ